jgi:hypothetical protein
MGRKEYYFRQRNYVGWQIICNELSTMNSTMSRTKVYSASSQQVADLTEENYGNIELILPVRY